MNPTNEFHHDQGDKGHHYDVHNFYKRMNDTTKQEDVGDYTSMLKTNNPNSIAPNNGTNFPLTLKIKTENDDQENRLPNNFTPLMKKEAGTPFDRTSFYFGKGNIKFKNIVDSNPL